MAQLLDVLFALANAAACLVIMAFAVVRVNDMTWSAPHLPRFSWIAAGGGAFGDFMLTLAGEINRFDWHVLITVAGAILLLQMSQHEWRPFFGDRRNQARPVAASRRGKYQVKPSDRNSDNAHT